MATTAWMDRKVVMVMSTNSQPTASGSVLRRQRDGTQISVPCPESIILYKYMGGVDRGDQIRGYYSCRLKSRKFYKYIFYFLFDVTITNTYTLYKNYCLERTLRNAKEFRLQLAQQLIGEYCSRRRLGRQSGVIAPLPMRHFPVRVNSDTTSKRRRGRCAKCSQLNHRCDTTWYCRECDLWLCHGGDPKEDCFLLWHQQVVGLAQ